MNCVYMLMAVAVHLLCVSSAALQRRCLAVDVVVKGAIGAAFASARTRAVDMRGAAAGAHLALLRPVAAAVGVAHALAVVANVAMWLVRRPPRCAQSRIRPRCLTWATRRRPRAERAARRDARAGRVGSAAGGAPGGSQGGSLDNCGGGVGRGERHGGRALSSRRRGIATPHGRVVILVARAERSSKTTTLFGNSLRQIHRELQRCNKIHRSTGKNSASEATEGTARIKRCGRNKTRV